MPSLADLLKGNSAAEQLFLWGVVAQVLNSLLSPFLEELNQLVSNLDPNQLITPAALADMVERGHLDIGAAQAEAQKQGVNNSRFALLVKNAGEPPGPMQLAEALRRGFINEQGGSDTDPTYENGIRQSRLQTQWGEVIKKLDRWIPSPNDAAEAAVRSMLDDQTARGFFQQFGGDPNFYDLVFNLHGAGPSPVEAGTLANRGIIPWEGTGPQSTTFAQAVAESRFKTKWTDAYKQLATYRPPPRTVTAMFREGSIDRDTATKLLLNYGVTPDMVPAYLTPKANTQTQKAHELTEATIVTLYTEQALDSGQAHDLLSKHGYQDEDITYILEAADIKRQLQESNLVVNVVKTMYLHGKITYNNAVTLLDAAQIVPNRRDYLLHLWDLEKQAGTKQLTEAQLMKAANAGVITQEVLKTKLQSMGYADDDADILIALGYSADTAASFIAGAAVGAQVGTLLPGAAIQ
jgi:hypothetical protein